MLLDRRFHRLPLAFLLLALLGSVCVLWLRFQVERDCRRVQLVLDDAQIRALCAATGSSTPGAYRRFHALGITGVALSEPTLAEAIQAGLVTVEYPAGPREARIRIAPGHEERISEAFSTGLPSREPGPGEPRLTVFGPGGRSAVYRATVAEVATLGMGCDREAARAIRAAGLEPVGRIYAYPGADPTNLRSRLAILHELGIRTVVFAGEEAAGFPGLLEETAAAFTELDLRYGSVEFGKQRGDSVLSRLLLNRLVRVHSVSPAEMARLTPGEAIERYARAAAERNIRLAYVRLPAGVSEGGLDGAAAYLASLSRAVAREGFGLAAALPFREVLPAGLRRVLPGIVGLGVGALAALLAAALLPLASHRQAGLAAGLGVVTALTAASGVSLLLQLLALGAAVLAPILALSLPALREDASGLRAAVGRFLSVSAVSLAGGLLTAALLSEAPYMLKVRGFVGIKLATAGPILAVGWILLTEMAAPYRDRREQSAAMGRRLREFLSEPLRVWHTFAMLVGLVAVALVLARSGNDSGLGVSETELRFRAVLDQVLGVRPRTKEFLIGHPALLLGIYLAGRSQVRNWAAPFLLAGVIGQSGTINSFCHLHTPIKLTVIRTAHGLWLGLLIGCVLVWLLERALARWARVSREPAG